MPINALIPVIANMGKYSVKETCQYLGINRSTLYVWVSKGKIQRGGVRKVNGRPFFFGKEILRVMKN